MRARLWCFRRRFWYMHFAWNSAVGPLLFAFDWRGCPGASAIFKLTTRGSMSRMAEHQAEDNLCRTTDVGCKTRKAIYRGSTATL